MLLIEKVTTDSMVRRSIRSTRPIRVAAKGKPHAYRIFFTVDDDAEIVPRAARATREKTALAGGIEDRGIS